MHELSYSLRHLTLRALGFGDPAKPMILALHGWLDNAMSFAPMAPYLDDFYVIALDITGHGLSSHRAPGAHYHLMDFVYDLHELIEAQQWQELTLLGHSMGGIIASLYSSCFNDRVARLICIESFGAMTNAPESSPQQLRESIESRLAAERRPASHPQNIDRTIQARASAGNISLESASLLVKRNVEHLDGEWQFRTDRRLRTLSSLRITEAQNEAFLRNIECPVLVIVGEQGFDSVRSAIEHRQDWVRQLRVVQCAGHHHLHMDHPVVVADKINEFLAESGRLGKC